jgi:PII-like signaling protein
MRTETKAQVIKIYIGEQDTWKGKPLYGALVARMQEAGIAGVTVLRGVEGYGAHHRIHTARFEVMCQGLPMIIEAVDTPEHVNSVLPILDEMVTEGLVTIRDVTAITYTKKSPTVE